MNLTKKASYKPEITGAKILLLFGILMIHSYALNELPYAHNWGCMIVFWLRKFVSGCVPMYFVISGFLMFQNVDKLDWTTYKSKLKSRFRSLVVPYLLWNIIGAIVFLAKVYLFGYPGFEVVKNGSFHVLEFIRGFWNVEGTGGSPFDFPLWFIRDLIILVLLSPILYIIAKRTYLLIALLLCVMFGPLKWHAFYFALGIWLTNHPNVYSKLYCVKRLPVYLAVCIVILVMYVQTDGVLSQVCWLGFILTMLAVSLSVGGLLNRIHSKVWDTIHQSFFFVYAFHGLYCSLLRRAIIKACGAESASALPILTAFIATVISLFVISVACYILLNRTMPRLALILSGNRK